MNPPRPPVITLLTDFGTRDVYIGVMKGVIAGRRPEARVIDLTHEVGPGDIASASFLLSTAWRYFPEGTVHVAVVDPGVGSERKAIAAEAGGHCFLAPDNGLLSAVLDELNPSRIVSIENASLFLHPVSQTFHGRDVFAPVAAAIAGGVSLDQVGPPLSEWVRLPGAEPRTGADGSVIGRVIHVDRFGNLVTNLRAPHLPSAPVIRIDRHTIRGISRTYASVPHGEPLALIGSSGRLEVSVNGGSAAALTGATIGTQITVTPSEVAP